MALRHLTATLTALLCVPLALPADAPTADEARRFVDAAEERMLEALARNERAAWVQANFITADTQAIASEAQTLLLQTTAELAKGAARFDGLELPYDVRRKLGLLKVALPLAAPAEAKEARELAALASKLEGLYGAGEYCPEGGAPCEDLGALSETMATSRDPEALLEAWKGWRTVSVEMRPLYERFAELGNSGARELGFPDLGAMWRSGYDMDPDAFAAELERLWSQVRPLYEQLHCHVRAKLNESYGDDVVASTGPIPAHLMGNMWAQSWGNLFDIVAPPLGGDVDVTALLAEKGIDEERMVRIGERFFTSLGFEPLPDTFWTRSLFTKPEDRDVVCHASAWPVDWADDLRIKMCIKIDEEDLVTIHHELGHIFYYQAYADAPTLYRNGANDGFHEAIGDTIALSVTPGYLKSIGLLDELPKQDGTLPFLMRQALEKIAFVPFGLVVDQWRWKVFAGEIPPEDYNAGWWALRTKYQGVVPPVPRSEADFDPGAKYHVPGNTPYTRYFLAHVLQFQFHEALCEAAGHEGPLHTCSIYGSEKAGERVREVLSMGAGRPWQDAMEAMTGQREMDGNAVLEYFAPLSAWLEKQNAGRTCGW